MAKVSEDTKEPATEARLQALEEASSEAQRMARQWREEAEGTHSSNHSHLLRTWSDAADRVADAITALGRPHG
jgi:hypothetical protein